VKLSFERDGQRQRREIQTSKAIDRAIAVVIVATLSQWLGLESVVVHAVAAIWA
jgi:hypothetical protein